MKVSYWAIYFETAYTFVYIRAMMGTGKYTRVISESY